MPNHYPTTESIKAYFDSPALNQSYLKKFAQPFDIFIYQKEQEAVPSRILYSDDADYSIVGSALDTILTSEPERFDQVFFIGGEIKPSELIISIVKNVFDFSRTEDRKFDTLNELQDLIQQAVLAHAYQPNWKIDTRINKIIELGFDYYEELKESEGKIIINANDFELVKTMANSIRNDNPIIFNNYLEHIDIYFQYPLYWNENDIDCKGLIDVMIINHADQTIQLIDIKSTGQHISSFKSSYESYGYDYQGAWYTRGIKAAVTLGLLPNYRISDCFSFIVVSKLNPLVSKTFDSFDTVNLENTITRSPAIFEDRMVINDTNRVYRKYGIRQLMDRYKQYNNYGQYIDDVSYVL